MVPVWALARRNGQAYHWDGLNTVAARGGAVVGARRRRHEAVGRSRHGALGRRGPAHALEPAPHHRLHAEGAGAASIPTPIDRALAQTGAGVWATACAECHGPGGRRTGTIIPQTEVGTDRHRMDMWTKSAAAAYNAFGEGRSWKFSKLPQHQRLRGHAARRPVAHRPVPPQRLRAVARRPARARGRRGRGGSGAATTCTTPSRVGFVTTGPEAAARGHPPGHLAARATATPATPTARNCPPPPSAPCWNT